MRDSVPQLTIVFCQLRSHHRGQCLDLLPGERFRNPAMTEASRKTYRPWNPAQYRQQTHSPLSKLPESDLVFFLLDTVPLLDLRRFYARYEDERRGAPPFDPTMMVCLLLYAYCV